MICFMLHRAASVPPDCEDGDAEGSLGKLEATAHLNAPFAEVPIDCLKLALIVNGETKAASL